MDKPIKIDKEHIGSIAAAINAAEAKTRTRKITAEQVIEICDGLTRKFGISKRAMEGIRISADPHAQTFSNTYKGRPESTHFNAVFKRGAWYMTSVFRATCGDRSSWNVSVIHTQASKDAIIDRMTNLYV